MNKTSNKTLPSVPISERSELFIGLVGAVGIDLDNVFQNIKDILENFNYDVHQIKISDFFYDSYLKEQYQVDIGEKDKDNKNIFQKCYSKIEGKDPTASMLKHNKFSNIYLKMEAGNKIRKKSGYLPILATCAIKEVQRIREEISQNGKGIAYVFQSLKHPEESKLLSEVYGPGYYQIGIYLEEECRVKFLKKSK